MFTTRRAFFKNSGLAMFGVGAAPAWLARAAFADTSSPQRKKILVAIFQRGAAGLSVLVSTVGLGAICGGAWMLLRPGLNGLTSVVLGHTLVISLAILGFTATDQFYVALPFVFVAGTAMVITGVGAQTLIQASVEPQMRGRVMALYGMIFRAGPALGAVLMGSLSERFGLRLPLAVGAVISVVVCALTWARQRRIAPLLESEPAPRGQGGSAVEKGAP